MPRRLSAARDVSTTTPRRGDVVRVEVRVDLPKGRGHVEAWQLLPHEFELVEGTNLRVYALGRSARTETFVLAFRATKRGPVDLAPVRLEWHDPLGILVPRADEACGVAQLEVRPRLPSLRRVHPIRVQATRLVPEGDPSPIGPPGTDFHEIRDYTWGDPPKSINWKATARRLSRGDESLPLVNEYEKEGKKTVWVLLDASGAMEVGTSLETALEHALEAGGSLAAHYLDRGYAVGFTAFNASSEAVLYPDHGRRQLRLVLRLISRLAPAPAGASGGLAAAVDRIRPFVRGGRPMAIVLTRLAGPSGELIGGLGRLVRLVSRRGAPAVYVVDTRPRTPLETDEAPLVLDALDAPLTAEVRATGARVIAWKPGIERFESAFLVGLRRASRTRTRALRGGARR